MNKKAFAFAVLFLCSPVTAQPAEQEKNFSPLYECVRKLPSASSLDYDLEFLANDLFYILDANTPELYLYTPYYAGKADLSQNIQRAVKAALNEEEFSAEPKPGQPFKPCCQSSLNYNIRIPYFSDDPSKPKGYFYITISDQSPGMYDEVYWDRADHKTKVIRHDKPFTKVAHHAMIIGAPHYLPGAPQTMPDFTDSKQPPIAGQENKKVEYFPLAIEGKLWDKNATTTFSGEAEDKLLSNIRYGLSHLPQEPKVGQPPGCPGAGCDWTYTEEQVAAAHKINMDSVHACKAAANELHVDIFSKP